jgi:hypothetical protein
MIPRAISRPLWFAALGAAAWANRDRLREGSQSVLRAVDRRRHGPPPDAALPPEERLALPLEPAVHATQFQ